MESLNDHEFASRTRGRLLAFVIITVFLGFLVRFVQLQIVEGPALSEAAVAQGLKRIEVIPVRGTIYDRRGRVVAASVPSFSVGVTRQDFDPYREQTLPLLARILGVDTNFILDKIHEGGYYTRFQPIKIWRDADERVIAAVEESHDQLPGVDILTESKREYVAPVRASHLLGYTKEISPAMLARISKTSDSDYYHPGDIVGTTGIEAYYEKQLRGVKGYEFVAVDARGQKQSRLNQGVSDQPSVDGRSISLGMDIDLQEYAEQLLGNAGHGAVVAMDPNNGDILALVSKPDFDLDLFSGKTTKAEYQSVMLDPSHPLYDRALQSRYPPGSTWKLMMAAACLTTKTIPFDYKIVCPGAFTYGNHTYHDDAVHGVTNVHESIVRSCDVFYYRMVLMLGIDSMYKYARMFGFDQPTGVDIGHEGSGFIPNTKRMNRLYPHGWTLGYVVSQGIGQGEIGVTPIQQAAYVSTFANHGLWVQPHAAHSIYNATTNHWDTVAYKTRKLPIPDTIINIVRDAMLGVVNEPGGTAHIAAITKPTIEVAGKTGTAQNPHGKDHAWFDCFAPFDHPKIAICVLVENAGFGGVVSAPIARKLIRYYLTGVREDPPPEVLPNTAAYQAMKQAKWAAAQAANSIAKILKMESDSGSRSRDTSHRSPAANPSPARGTTPHPKPEAPTKHHEATDHREATQHRKASQPRRTSRNG